MPGGFLEIIELRPRVDRGLHVLAFLLAPAAVAAAWLADPATLPGGLRAAVLLAGAAGLGAAAWHRRRAWPRRAVLLPDGQWRLGGDGAAVVPARLARCWGAGAGPLIGLEWACADGGRRSAWLLRADTDARTWRRLRVRLRLA